MDPLYTSCWSLLSARTPLLHVHCAPVGALRIPSAPPLLLLAAIIQRDGTKTSRFRQQTVQCCPMLTAAPRCCCCCFNPICYCI
jgi:hypothetical protein